MSINSSIATSQPLHSPPLSLKEGDVTEELRDLLASLPRANGWITLDLYQFQGFWIVPRALQGLLACQQHFQPQKTDIHLVTLPKSGTTWLKALLFSLVNRARYPPAGHTNNNQHPLLSNNPHDLVPFLELELYPHDTGVSSSDTHHPTSPRLFASHLPYLCLPESVKCTSSCKIVYLCRNPKDTFVSLWHFPNKVRPPNLGTLSIEEAFDRFCRGESPHGPYWDHVLGYWKASSENPQKVFFFKYEELKEQSTFHLRRLAEFLGCPFSPQEEASGVLDDILGLCSFDNLTNLKVNKTGKLSYGIEHKDFFRCGEAGDWKNYLTTEMADRIDHIIIEQKLSEFGLKL